MAAKTGAAVLAGGAIISLPLLAQAQWRTPWAYEGEKGPAHWAELDSDYATCGSGKAQSPIDIRNPRKSKLPALAFAFKSGLLNLINNGYTAVRVDYKPGNGDILSVDGKQYELTQFHFHHPSEETIAGKPADMVLHLMYQGADGKVVGVAVLMRQGKANPAVAELWTQMPEKPGAYHLIADVAFDPTGLMPKERGYYRYEGSVTAPPCNEGVTWYVLKTPMTVSAEQIAEFAKLYPHDVRPIQNLNGRLVEESE